MEVLLELSPGTGWLARENDRILYLPHAEAIDVAHDVIEPLLVARAGDDAFALLGEWVETDRPLPVLVLISLDDPLRVAGVGVRALEGVSAAGVDSTVIVGRPSEPTEIPEIRSVALHDEDERASGMLVEGVVRAGGFRLHLHPGPTHRPAEATEMDASTASLHLHVDQYSIAVGAGLVLGRWPYRHERLDPALEPLIIADPAVSRLHAEVRPRDDGIVVIDRSSHNGTLVTDGSTDRSFRLEPEVAFPVSVGDRIRLGDTEVVIAAGPQDD